MPKKSLNDSQTKVCPECGQPMPAPFTAPAGWNCSCGQTNITSNFCPECGQKNPNLVETWDCPDCNTTGIKSKFCPNCGRAKEA